MQRTRGHLLRDARDGFLPACQEIFIGREPVCHATFIRRGCSCSCSWTRNPLASGTVCSHLQRPLPVDALQRAILQHELLLPAID